MKDLLAADFNKDGKLVGYPSGSTMLLIHASWCHFCNITKPVIEKLSAVPRNRTSGAEFVHLELDTTSDPIAKSYKKVLPVNVTGLPTILGYKDGLFVAQYNGDRSQASLQQFMDNLQTV
jgi:thiol-disulfide isomerase/thioredoxin